MRKNVVAIWLTVGAVAIGAGYLVGRAIIRWQDRTDPPVTALSE